MMKTFAGIEKSLAEYNNASVVLQSIPYDGTSTWGKGADCGFEAFLEASENMELYDIETQSEVYKRGIHILPELHIQPTPEAMTGEIYSVVSGILRSDKFPTFFGGEHSVSIGIIRAFREVYKDLTVLQLDAHTDLRPEYMGSIFNHACAMHDAAETTNLLQVGIRSMDSSEIPFLHHDKCFFSEDMYGTTGWMQQSIDLMGDDVYITFDLDVFDPSVMPSTGTPEPGGLDWDTVIRYLRRVFDQKNVVGFDIVELAPLEHLSYPQFLVAKLYYKMLSYKFMQR